VAESIIRGTSPRRCEDKELFYTTEDKREEGRHVNFEDLKMWLIEYVNPP